MSILQMEFDSNQLIIEDRLFYPVDDSMVLFHNSLTQETIKMHEYADKEKLVHLQMIGELLFAADNPKAGSIIFPKYFLSSMKDDTETYFAASDLPRDYCSAMAVALEKASEITTFAIYTRVIAAMNFAQVLNTVYERLGSELHSIRPSSMKVNIENGNVYLDVVPWLMTISENDADCAPVDQGWCAANGTGVDPHELEYFAIYSIFCLLFGADPFDGQMTLTEFPLLTAEAKREIRSGAYPFVFANRINCCTKYIGQKMYGKWKAFPTFLRDAFDKAFIQASLDKEALPTLKEILEMTRRLRDCLLLVNRQVRFLDSSVNSSVLWIQTNGYEIPVWEKKALYWYHVGIPFREENNGIVGGILLKDGKSYLQNLSGETWSSQYENIYGFVQHGKLIELNAGLCIITSNNTEILVRGTGILDPKTSEPENEINISADAVIMSDEEAPHSVTMEKDESEE